jgi:hypothetical protein
LITTSNIALSGKIQNHDFRKESTLSEEKLPSMPKFNAFTYKPTVQDSYAGQRLWVESSNGWCEEETANYRPLPD